jgi:hypothetical protein
MALTERINLYKKIENKRGNPLMVYVTSQRPGAVGGMAGDVIDEFVDQIKVIDKSQHDTVDLLIESTGGDPLVSWRVISLIRTSFKNVNVLVPYSAFSAATLLVLGVNEIWMGPFGSLGPIDPQISIRRKDGTTQKFGYEDIASFLSFVREEGGITEQQYLKGALEKLCESVEPQVLGFAKRSSSLSVSIGEKMLQMHITDAEEKAQAHSIALKLNKSFFSHGHSLSRKDAKEIGLNVKTPDEELEKLMWDIHEDFEKEIQTRTPFDPLAEYLKNPQASPLLQSPPPINIPPQINQQAAIQILKNYFDQQLNVQLPEVEIELKYGFMESIRTASEFFMKGRILVQRNLNMQFKGNMMPLDKGWRKVEINGENEPNVPTQPTTE